MNFKQLNDKIIDQFFLMQEYKLFRVKMSGDSVQETYINGFKEGQNPIFRDPNSSEHNCNNDKNFIRRYGNVVAIDDNNEIITMFDIDVEGTIYFDTIENLKNVLKSKEIENVFFETFNELHNLPYEKTTKTQNNFQLGVKKTFKKYSQEEVEKFGVVNTTDVYTFNHFHVFLDTKFVDKTGNSIESIMASYRDAKNVFKRGLDEITVDVLETVIDLIKQKSILDGEAHLLKVEAFLKLKNKYNDNDNWCWVNSYQLPIAKFRNELIGVLCTELSQGEDLTKACQNWNKRVDPANYMKAVAPITNAQKEMARKFVEENGYVESFDRRFATLDDIKASEILHVGNRMKNVSIFDNINTLLLLNNLIIIKII